MGFLSVLWLVCALFGGLAQGSAIPMWEYLSKQEKTSYIYSLFANQVDKFCDKPSIPICGRQLLTYGLRTLKNMDEEDLDLMDPYQRDANNLIWETLMQGHRFQKTTPKPQETSPKAKPNSYEDEESFSDLEDGNVYVLPPPKGFVYTKAEGGDEPVEDILKTPDGKGVFNRFQNQYRPVAVTTEKIIVGSSTNKKADSEPYLVPLSGPMVVRVYPDGRPVTDTQTPQDEDLRQYELQHVKVPDV